MVQLIHIIETEEDIEPHKVINASLHTMLDIILKMAN